MRLLTLICGISLVLISCADFAMIDKMKEGVLDTTGAGLELGNIPNFNPQTEKVFHRSDEWGKYNYR